MRDRLNSQLRELLPLVMFGAALAGLLGAARAAVEISSILECTGAMGGTRPTTAIGERHTAPIR